MDVWLIAVVLGGWVLGGKSVTAWALEGGQSQPSPNLKTDTLEWAALLTGLWRLFKQRPSAANFTHFLCCVQHTSLKKKKISTQKMEEFNVYQDLNEGFTLHVLFWRRWLPELLNDGLTACKPSLHSRCHLCEAKKKIPLLLQVYFPSKAVGFNFLTIFGMTLSDPVGIKSPVSSCCLGDD